MSKKWIWLPDWASDLTLWEDDLADVSSDGHVFIPYDKMIKNLNDPYKLPGMNAAETVVGWGLGALVLLLNASKRPTGQKWILLSPFADFCDEDGVWTKQNLTFMAHQMQTTLEPALNSFGEQLAEEFGEWQEDWQSSARKMDPAILAEGINFLATHQLTEPVAESDGIQVAYGRMDKLILPVQTLKLKKFLPAATFRERPKAGHWPPMLLL